MPNLVLNVTPMAQIQAMFEDAFFSPVRLALAAENAGVDGLVAIYTAQETGVSREDLEQLKQLRGTFLNVLVPFHPDAVRQVLAVAPDMVTLVQFSGKSHLPAALPVSDLREDLETLIADFNANGISTAVMIAPDFDTLKVVGKLQVDAVILDCHEYTNAPDSNARLMAEENLQSTARGAVKLGLAVNLMGGIDMVHLPALKRVPLVTDVILDVAILKHAMYSGLENAVQRFRQALQFDGETL